MLVRLIARLKDSVDEYVIRNMISYIVAKTYLKKNDGFTVYTFSYLTKKGDKWFFSLNGSELTVKYYGDMAGFLRGTEFLKVGYELENLVPTEKVKLVFQVTAPVMNEPFEISDLYYPVKCEIVEVIR